MRTPSTTSRDNVAQLGLFTSPEVEELKQMVHRRPLVTETQAALTVAPRGKKLRAMVLEELRKRGPMTDEQLERLPIFRNCGQTTIRKRRGELCKCFDVVLAGYQRNSRGCQMAVWKAKEQGSVTQ